MTVSTNKYKKMRGFDGKTRSAKLFRRKQLEIKARAAALALALLVSAPASAAVMDISDLAGFTQSGASGTSGNGYLWVSPKYLFEPGTTIDFGTAAVIGDPTDHRAPCGPPTIFTCMAQTGSFAWRYLTDGEGGFPSNPLDLGSGYCITTTDFCAPDVFRLLFTLGPDNNGIQLAFQGSSLRITPVPLPAAWLLFAAGLGITLLRRTTP